MKTFDLVKWKVPKLNIKNAQLQWKTFNVARVFKKYTLEHA